MLRILIADQYEVVREGLRIHLEAEPGWKVVAEAANGPDAIKKAIQTKPDVAVLGYMLPGLNGIEATHQIREQAPETKVLIFTTQSTENLLGEFLEAGASGCVQKSEPMARLIEAVRDAACRKAPPGERKKPNGSGTHLTARERTIVRLIADGESNKRIAASLGIDVKTVETHRANVMRKLELGSAADLVRYAVRSGLTVA